MKADTVYINGIVYTVDKQNNIAEAVAVGEGRIIAVGTTEQVMELADGDTHIVDLEGKMMLPSFFEAHAHCNSTAEILFSVQLKGCENEADMLLRIKAFSEKNHDLRQITGSGWSLSDFGRQGPTKESLDEIRSDIPIVMYSEDYHMAWANSKALANANITKDTPDPVGGSIQRDENGDATGLLRDNAKIMVVDTLSDFTEEQYIEAYEEYQKVSNSYGFTGVMDAVIPPGTCCIPAYCRYYTQGKPTMYTRAAQVFDIRHNEKRFELIKDENEKYRVGTLFGANIVKFFIDGVVQGKTAILIEPYSDSTPEEPFYGQKNWEQDKLNEAVCSADKKGFQIHAHTIGDGAVQMMLNAFEYTEKQNGSLKEKRHSVTHLELMAEKDKKRMADMGIIAVINPYWYFRDLCYYTIYQEYLGSERADMQYPVRSLKEAGVLLASGSDYPVTLPVNPFEGMQLGVTRRAPKTGSCKMSYSAIPDADDPASYDPLNPEEAVSLEDMLKSYTINGAYAYFLDKETGSIEIGKSADMIIIDKNIFEIDPYTIRDVRVLETIFKGETVYSRKEGC